MLKKFCVVVMCLAMVGVSAWAQNPTPQKEPPAPTPAPKSTEGPISVAVVLNRAISNIEREFVPAAEAMPDDKFEYAPTNGEFKGVRTYGQQVRHVATANYMFGSLILQQKPPIDLQGENGPADIKTKADSIKYLKDSYAYLHKAADSVTDKNMLDMIDLPFGPGAKGSRLGIGILSVGHGFDHYGQMVEYLRSNGIIPPASRQQ